MKSTEEILFEILAVLRGMDKRLEHLERVAGPVYRLNTIPTQQERERAEKEKLARFRLPRAISANLAEPK